MAAIRPTRNSDVISATPPALLTASKTATTSTAAAAPANQIGTARVPAAESGISCPLFVTLSPRAPTDFAHYGAPDEAWLPPISTGSHPRLVGAGEFVIRIPLPSSHWSQTHERSSIRP